MKKPVPKICPVCKSKSVIPFMGFSLGIQFQCRKCRYIGPLVIETGRAQKLKCIQRKL